MVVTVRLPVPLWLGVFDGVVDCVEVPVKELVTIGVPVLEGVAVIEAVTLVVPVKLLVIV